LNQKQSLPINVENRELAAGREEKLKALVTSGRFVRVEAMVRELGVSAATIRRDLELLEQKGALRRVHGGAVAVESNLDEPLFDDKTQIAAPEKLDIARAAVALVKPGSSIFLDGGSTILAMAPLLRDMTDLTVVTNSLRVAHELAGGGPTLIIVGGDLRRRSQTMVGPLTEPILSSLHMDQAFVGTIGLDLRNGLTTTDPREAFTKRLILRQAQQIVLLADSTKAGKTSFVRFGSPEDAHVFITDSRSRPSSAKASASSRFNRLEPKGKTTHAQLPQRPEAGLHAGNHLPRQDSQIPVRPHA
jgi:DeoR/GlpR family transcriptional regulator of sugar metabolism